MSTFDLFINGIQPDRTAETQKIIEDISKRMRISIQEADRIIKTPNTRVSKSISKSQAETLQQTLFKIGVICLCKPSAADIGLFLEPIESNEEVDSLIACPNCNKEFSDDSNIPPEKCDNCGVNIEKFLKINSTQNEQIK